MNSLLETIGFYLGYIEGWFEGMPRTNAKLTYYTSFDKSLFESFLEENIKVVQIGRNEMAIHISGEDLADALLGLPTAGKFRILDISTKPFRHALERAVMMDVAEIQERDSFWGFIKRLWGAK